MRKTLADQDILGAIKNHQPRGTMTFAIRNYLVKPFPGVTTDEIRRRLVRMEKGGLVRRASTMYARQICWALPEEG